VARSDFGERHRRAGGPISLYVPMQAEEKLFSVIVVDERSDLTTPVGPENQRLHGRPEDSAHRPGAGPVAGGIGRRIEARLTRLACSSQGGVHGASWRSFWRHSGGHHLSNAITWRRTQGPSTPAFSPWTKLCMKGQDGTQNAALSAETVIRSVEMVSRRVGRSEPQSSLSEMATRPQTLRVTLPASRGTAARSSHHHRSGPTGCTDLMCVVCERLYGGL